MVVDPNPFSARLRRQIIAFAREGRRLLSNWNEPGGGETLSPKTRLQWEKRFGELEKAAVSVSSFSLYPLLQQVWEGHSRLVRMIRKDLATIQGTEPAEKTGEEVVEETAEDPERNKEKHEDCPTPPKKPVPIGGHVLPPLPYPYEALEPYIDAKTMRLHHDEHHKSYVDGLNKAEIMMAQARKTGNFNLIKHWEREAAFNGAGHYLHTIFWEIMSPKGGGKPSGKLLKQIRKDFGSFEAFKKHFSAAAEKVEGGGWAILVWAPRAQRLEILQAEKHQNLSQWDVVPLLVLDVWEHAYYLKYPNKRKAYIRAWWNVVNWPAVECRYLQARKLFWKPY
ncbi:superoxide dismutase [Melghirimyces profundicolus]|uniref:superoxide dismutase n=1 Tax=Melghirimyces profundicolus TaxID=1242148 RepID=A0A2T6C4K2_9BACL|nr:superoxide dismutase [Melghirimyces profundicolus]PTX63207.1 superoxide dismutase [Melghirimyces profundicolus]